jgi:hypothetical protein
MVSAHAREHRAAHVRAAVGVHQLLARASDAVLPRAPRVEPTPCEPHPVRSADDLQPVASTTLTDAQLSELAAQHNRSVVRIDRDRAVYGPARDSRVH